MTDTAAGVSTLLKNLHNALVVDVRSPSEYTHAHIPGALSMPLFSDAQRAEIGTLYKQKGREAAMLHALDYYGPNMKVIVTQLEQQRRQSQKRNGVETEVIVHCWRGGMRSGVVCWMLELFGYNVVKLEGGYKRYRGLVLEQLKNQYHLSIVGGRTGAAKTQVIHALQRLGEQAVDLEQLARHQGSAFGGIGQTDKPSQEQFENDLALHLQMTDETKNIWLEDESHRIGAVNIPNELWVQMRNAKVYYLDVPFELRLQHLAETYGRLPVAALVEATVRIRKKLGGLQMQQVIDHLDGKNITAAFRILLQYYDKAYDEATSKREPGSIVRIATNTIDPEQNARLILQTINS